MPACADTLGPVDATDVPKRWPPGPLRDFLEGLQAPDFPYVDGAPTWWLRCWRSVVDTKFKVEFREASPGHLVHHAAKASGSASRRRKSSQTSRRTGRRTCSVLKSYDPHSNDYDEKMVVALSDPNGGN